MSNTQRDQSGLGVLAEFPNIGIWEAYSPSALFSDVPTDGTAGFAVGCTFIRTNGAAGSEYYINEGSLGSCAFKAVNSVLLADLDAAGKNILNVGTFRGNHNIATAYNVGDVIWDDSGLAISVECIRAHTNQPTSNATYWRAINRSTLISYATAGNGLLDDGASFFSMDVIRILPIGGPQSNLVNSNADIGSTDGVHQPVRCVALCGGSGISDGADSSALSHSYVTGFSPTVPAVRSHADSSSSITDGTNCHSDSLGQLTHGTNCRAGSAGSITGTSNAAQATSCCVDAGGAVNGNVTYCGAFGHLTVVNASGGFAIGAGITNSTGNCVEIGYSDTTKVRVDASGLNVLGALNASGLLGFRNQPTDTYGAAMTIDVTKSSHVVNASFTTSGTVTYTPSAAGTKGDLLVILTAADASGTVTATFASTFHSSGTQATTASHFSSIMFQSDGTRWVELNRTTDLA